MRIIVSWKFINVFANKYVLRNLSKVSIVAVCSIFKGRLFHNIGAAIKNAQSSIVSGALNENIVQNHLNIALLNVS